MATRIILYISIIFLAISCTKEVKIDLPKFEQKIVVDGQIQPGMPPIIVLSKSQDLYAPTDLATIQNNFVTGAHITVSDGTTSVVLDLICSDSIPPALQPLVAAALGISTSDLASSNFCAYTTFNTAIFGIVGRTYSLTIDVEDRTYTSSTTIMPPPAISSTFFKYNGKYTDRGYAWVVLNDDAAVYNTYFLKVKELKNDTRFYTAFGPAFDDQYFNGLQFKYAVSNAGSYQNDALSDDDKGYFFVGDTAVIELSSMDINVYNFNLQKYAQVDNGGNPFASPANIPTNIVGGALGVWAGYSPIYDTVPCYP